MAGAKPDRDEPPKECMGSVIMIARELEYLKSLSPDGVITGESAEQYLRDSPGRKGLTRIGLMYYLIARQVPRPIGDGFLPDPGELINSSEFGRLQ